MAIIMKLDGDAEHGWMGEVHDGEVMKSYSPAGANPMEAFFEMMHAHFAACEPAAAEPTAVPEDVLIEEATTEALNEQQVEAADEAPIAVADIDGALAEDRKTYPENPQAGG